MSTTDHSSFDVSDQQLHKRSDLHLLRKLWHISTGSLGLYAFFKFPESQQLLAIITLVIAALGLGLDLFRKKNKRFNRIFIKAAGPLMRRSEKEGVSGLPFYALGVSIALFLFRPEIATLAVMFLVFSDPLSSFFGILFGKDKILPNKSLQGAIAGFFTCYIITLFYIINNAVLDTNILVFSIVAGVIGSLSELVSALNIDDNLTIPVLSGLGLTLLNTVVKVFP